jgi:hypothetical protein
MLMNRVAKWECLLPPKSDLFVKKLSVSKNGVTTEPEKFRAWKTMGKGHARHLKWTETNVLATIWDAHIIAIRYKWFGWFSLWLISENNNNWKISPGKTKEQELSHHFISGVSVQLLACLLVPITHVRGKKIKNSIPLKSDIFRKMKLTILAL